jgi:heptaprenylglyceryl phosphate synthase
LGNRPPENLVDLEASGSSPGPPPSLVGAKVKDKTETALNTAVGGGTMTLQEAQDIIQTGW